MENGRVFTDNVENVSIISDNKLLDNFSYQQIKGRLVNSKKNNVIKNIGLLGKNSFIIYFFHFVLFYFLLIGYKYQLKPRLDVFMSQNKLGKNGKNSFKKQIKDLKMSKKHKININLLGDEFYKIRIR